MLGLFWVNQKSEAHPYGKVRLYMDCPRLLGYWIRCVYFIGWLLPLLTDGHFIGDVQQPVSEVSKTLQMGQLPWWYGGHLGEPEETCECGSLQFVSHPPVPWVFLLAAPAIRWNWGRYIRGSNDGQSWVWFIAEASPRQSSAAALGVLVIIVEEVDLVEVWSCLSITAPSPT
jgi:hypothetical protein